MTKEALKLALEALESYSKSAYIKQAHPKRWANGNKAITAIKEALAQPEQEPEDLTIAYMAGLSRGKDLALQRTWVGLTDEEKQAIYEEHRTHVGTMFTALEDRLKEKNQ